MEKYNINRYHTARQGKALAAWLNGPESKGMPSAQWIRFSVSLDDNCRKHEVSPGEVIRSLFQTGTGDTLPGVPDLSTLTDEEIVESFKRTPFVLPLPVTLRPECRLNGNRFAFSLVPVDEDSKWLQVWGELYNSGNVSRLKVCPNCEKFFYASGRSDQKTCSQKCNGLLWQRTPKGRKARRNYLRSYRARMKKMSEEMAKGYSRKRGRRLHDTLKKGE